MNIAYFMNGELYDVSPRLNPDNLFEDRDIAYHADKIVSDDVEYDLSNVDDVKAIQIPAFKAIIPAVLELSYIMKIRCGVVEDVELIPSFVQKTIELMRASKFIWRDRDYMQVIRNYYRCGMFEEGDAFEFAYRDHELFEIEDEQEHARTKEYFRRKWIKHNEYALIREKLPQIAPDTVKGYLQMRGKRTDRFMQIKEKAEAVGIVIDLGIK